MKHDSSLPEIAQEQMSWVRANGLTDRERAERLYRMGELAAAAELFAKEMIQ